MKKSSFVVLVFVSLLLLSSSAYTEEARLLRQPTVSDDLVAFVYANDIWTVSRSGGDAQRLTTHPGLESYPVFSPDGKYTLIPTRVI